MKLKYETPEMEVIVFTEQEIATYTVKPSIDLFDARGNLIDDSNSEQAFT